MIVNVYNAKELLIVIASICGELSTDVELPDITIGTTGNAILSLKKEKVFSVNKKEKRVRFRWGIEGQEGIKEISTRLYAHYVFLTNNHKFKSGDNSIKRQRESSEDSLFLLLSQVHVDNIKIEYKPNNFGQNKDQRIFFEKGEKVFPNIGEILNLKEFTGILPDGNGFFYSSRILKKMLSSSGTSRINTSKANGILLANKNSYVVYGETLLEGKTSKTAERAMRDFSFRIKENAFGRGNCEKYNRNSSGMAIVLLDKDGKKYKREIKSIVKSNSFLLDKIYESYHLIPKNENGRRVLKIIEKQNWEHRLLKSLYGNNIEKTGINDGYAEEGYRSWELLSCNYKKLRVIMKAVFSGETIDIVCFSWQAEIVKEITKNINTRIRIAKFGE